MSNITTNLAEQINEKHRAAIRAAGEAVEYARECGELLSQAKAGCKHGDWLPWLQANCEVSPRQAQRYMRLAENWTAIESKNDATSHLTIDGALRLLNHDPAERQPTLADVQVVYAQLKTLFAEAISAIDNANHANHVPLLAHLARVSGKLQNIIAEQRIRAELMIGRILAGEFDDRQIPDPNNVDPVWFDSLRMHVDACFAAVESLSTVC